MKYLLLILLALPTSAGAQIYNYFSPGCALSGNATSQSVNLNTGGCIVGNLSVNNLDGGIGASASTYFSGAGTWTTPAGGVPGGINQQVQVNNAGTFAGYPNFTWNNSINTMYLGYSTSSTNGSLVIGGSGTGVGTVRGGAELDLSGNPLILYTTSGGALNLAGSAGTGAGTGTSISMTAGATGLTSTSPGGAVTITGGVGNASAVGGQISLVGGSGYSTTGTGGNVSIQGGLGNTASHSGQVNVLTNNTTRMTIPNTGGLFISAPAIGTALGMTGLSGSTALQVTSGSGSTTASADISALRAGSTVNAVLEGPNLALIDSTNATETLLQNSGGQTELWQYNGGWNQIFKVGTARGLTVNAPASGVALTVNAVSSTPAANIVGTAGTIFSSHALQVSSPNTAGQSNGMRIIAGTNSGDSQLVLTNAANTLNYWEFWGNGALTSNGQVNKGAGTVNTSGLYVNGASVGTASFTVATGTGGTSPTLSTCVHCSGTTGVSRSGTGTYSITHNDGLGAPGSGGMVCGLAGGGGTINNVMILTDAFSSANATVQTYNPTSGALEDVSTSFICIHTN